MKLTILEMATLLMGVTMLAACSEGEDIMDVQPVQPGTYTLSVESMKSLDAQASTRGLTLSGSTLNATWATTDHVYVKKGSTWATGSLQPLAAGATATLKGTLTNVTIAAGDELTLRFPMRGTPNYIGQRGTLDDIAQHYDNATATATVTAVSANGRVAASAVSFTNEQAIAKFTLLDDADGTTPVYATNLTVTVGSNTYSVNPAAATNVFYVAIPGFSNQTVRLSATAATGFYEYDKAGVTFANSQYYDISVKMSKAADVYTDATEWNASSETNPVLMIDTYPADHRVIVTRSNGIVDFNGKTTSVSDNIHIRNNVTTDTVTLRNGTLNFIDGIGGWDIGYVGTVVLENMTVTSNVYADGHNLIIMSGIYDGGICNYKPDNVAAGTVKIYGGYFNILRAGGEPPRTRGPITVYGGKFKNDPRSYINVTVPSGYSVIANPDADAATYPWMVVAN